MTSKQIHFRHLNKVKRIALTNHPEYLDKTFKELVALGQINTTNIETKKERVISITKWCEFTCLKINTCKCRMVWKDKCFTRYEARQIRTPYNYNLLIIMRKRDSLTLHTLSGPWRGLAFLQMNLTMESKKEIQMKGVSAMSTKT